VQLSLFNLQFLLWLRVTPRLAVIILTSTTTANYTMTANATTNMTETMTQTTPKTMTATSPPT
jgi:hypothetical protein